MLVEKCTSHSFQLQDVDALCCEISCRCLPVVDITHQHFTHNQHIAHTSTAVFSASVAVPVLLVSQCLCSLLVFWTHSVAQTARLSVAQEKECFHTVAEQQQLQGFRPRWSAPHQLLQQIISRARVVEYILPAPVVIAVRASASHDGPDAVPRSDAAGTGASAAAHGTDAADAAAHGKRALSHLYKDWVTSALPALAGSLSRIGLCSVVPVHLMVVPNPTLKS